MGENKLLEFIFKVKVILDNKKEKIVGTAFIIDEQYALTAQHVIEECKSGTMILERYDGKEIIKECFVECGIKNKEKRIDIAVIRYQYSHKVYNEVLEFSTKEIKLYDKYETYGFPKYNKYDEYYISGEIISPEGRMSIINSTGEYKNISLYEGVSGAPLIIEKTIRGIIVTETLTSDISKPELNACYFDNVLIYTEANELDEESRKVNSILKKYCSRKVIEEEEKNLDPFYKCYETQYENIINKKNLSEKVLDKCPNFPPVVLNSWNRKCVQARVELEKVTSNEKKAILMAVFFPCVEYIEEQLYIVDLSTPEKLIESVQKLKEITVEYVQERKKDYSYGIENMILFENTIFDLIDSCFLSFESYV